MTKIEQLEHDIMTLNQAELAMLRSWFQNYFSDEWDKQIEKDVKTGKLDLLAREALANHQAGLTKPLTPGTSEL